MQPKNVMAFFFFFCCHSILCQQTLSVIRSGSLSRVVTSSASFKNGIVCLSEILLASHLSLMKIICHLLPICSVLDFPLSNQPLTTWGITSSAFLEMSPHTSCLQLNSHIHAPFKYICTAFCYSCNCSPPPLSPYRSLNSAWKICLEWTDNAPHKISMPHIKLCRIIKINFFHLGKQIAKPELTVYKFSLLNNA